MDKTGQLTIIGEGCLLEGALAVPHDVRIDGTLKGKIAAEGVLTLSESGSIEATDVTAKSALIFGRLTGNLNTEDRVELGGSASLIGDLKTRELVINEGARFQGHCAMIETKKTKV
jgi:cytoskeletal protein CcmA (bactofilin family)